MSLLLPASLAHGQVMAAIHTEVFPPYEAWSPDALTQQLALPGGFGLLAGSDGFVLARVIADEAEILTLAVLSQARRRGVGQQLMSAAHAQAAAAGAAAMLLEVAHNNMAARALYAGLGYQAVGHRRHYYADGGDALILRCTLSQSEVTPSAPVSQRKT